MSFTVRVQMPAALKDAPEAFGAALRTGVTKATALVTNAAITNAPRRYGTLKRSIHMAPIEIAGKMTLGTVIQDRNVAKYGPFVEQGTGLYGPRHELIKPVNAKAMRWKDAGAKNGFRFARSTKGMRAQPYMRPALVENIGHIEQTISAELKAAAAKLGGG